MRENNLFRWIGGSILTISLIAFVVSQQDKIREQAEQLLQFEAQVSSLESMLATSNAANEQIQAENAQLRVENQHLLDSIAFLSSEVTAFQEKLRHSQSTLKGIRAEMRKKDLELKTLKARLTQLQKLESPSQAALVQKQVVVAQIKEVIRQKNQLSDLENDETGIAGRAEDDLLATEAEKRRLEQIDNVVKNTTVNYHSVKCQKTRTSAPFAKMDEDGSNWVYTVAQFDLKNASQDALDEEYFRMKIVSTDTGEELPYMESAGTYKKPVDSAGFTFQWQDNPTEVVYINMQVKNDQNYDLKIYYISDDKEYLIPGSVYPLLRNGRSVRP